MMNMLSPQAMGGGAAPQPNSGQTQLQIGQMPMQGENPVYHMPGQPHGGFAGGGPQMGGYRNALMDWLHQLPQMGLGDPRAGMQAMQSWLQARPDRASFFGPGGNPSSPGAPGVMPIMNPGAGPVMTPGGGGTGVPLQGTAASQPALVPPQQVGTQMGVIGATPAINGFGLPGY